jgi:hypothetical protein
VLSAGVTFINADAANVLVTFSYCHFISDSGSEIDESSIYTNQGTTSLVFSHVTVWNVTHKGEYDSFIRAAKIRSLFINDSLFMNVQHVHNDFGYGACFYL